MDTASKELPGKTKPLHIDRRSLFNSAEENESSAGTKKVDCIGMSLESHDFPTHALCVTPNVIHKLLH